MPTIRTERLLLRQPVPEDAEAMFEILSDPIAMAYWSTPPHQSLAQTQAWIDRMVASSAAGGHGDFMVELDGRMIGNAGFSRVPEIGYILHRAFWGRGLGRESVAAAIGFGFETLNLPAITADVDPRNTASLHLLERLGFARTGHAERTFNVGGTWVDSLYLTLERPDLHPKA